MSSIMSSIMSRQKNGNGLCLMAYGFSCDAIRCGAMRYGAMRIPVMMVVIVVIVMMEGANCGVREGLWVCGLSIWMVLVAVFAVLTAMIWRYKMRCELR
ncbi:hypothetical protein BZA77DRAFT_316502 [Pyronema omphalodes]|nr:hypothetical protein BZA77DRAFT_316502 [Pyronema omphalodes]